MRIELASLYVDSPKHQNKFITKYVNSLIETNDETIKTKITTELVECFQSANKEYNKIGKVITGFAVSFSVRTHAGDLLEDCYLKYRTPDGSVCKIRAPLQQFLCFTELRPYTALMLKTARKNKIHMTVWPVDNVDVPWENAIANNPFKIGIEL
jgi:hypothetical protein